MCNKCSRDVMVIVAGKAVTAVASMFTIKINYPPTDGQLKLQSNIYQSDMGNNMEVAQLGLKKKLFVSCNPTDPTISLPTLRLFTSRRETSS